MWREKHKKKPRFLKISVIIALAVFAGLIFTVYKSNFFAIKKIEIEAGNISCADTEQLKNSLNILGQNFFLINFSKIENDLKKKFICIKTASGSKFLPDKVRIKISNRQAVAILASLRSEEATFSATPSADLVSDNYLIDNEGVVFGKVDSDLNIPKILIYNQEIFISQKPGVEISNAIKILDKIKSLSIQINKAWINQGIFVINSTFPVSQMIFRLDGDINIQLASLQLILDKAKIDLKEMEFIDLRFDKPVVKFAPIKHG